MKTGILGFVVLSLSSIPVTAEQKTKDKYAVIMDYRKMHKTKIYSTGAEEESNIALLNIGAT